MLDREGVSVAYEVVDFGGRVIQHGAFGPRYS
jgi:hypothetical protein